MRITVLITLFGCIIIGNSAAAQESDFKCWGVAKVAIERLPDGVRAQRSATQSVPVNKVIPADLVFFSAVPRLGCPNGIVGLVTKVQPGIITFVTFAAEPKEQLIIFPTKENPKGNLWYEWHPDFRTFEPETDPPRPGEKGYKPK